MTDDRQRTLVRSLGVVPATAIVIGSVLGTGVFLKSAGMAATVGGVTYVMAAWLAAGLLSAAGGLVYAELGARFPEAGGEYVYLREAFGDLAAFLYGWTRFWIISPGSIAAYAVGSATFLTGVWIPSGKLVANLVAVGLIIIFTALNCLSVAVSGYSQTVLTVLKAIVIVGLSIAALVHGPGPTAHAVAATTASWPGPIALGSAVLAALWAYDGWNNLPMMAGEMKNAERNVPLALGLGLLVVILLYLGINASYFFTLGLPEVASANSSFHPDALPVATKAASIYLGPVAIRVLALAFVLSAIGAMNGQILAGARVPYAMAKDGIFFRSLASLSRTTRIPMRAVISQSVIASALALSGSFDELTEAVVFAAWIFYAVTTVALFRFRKGPGGAPKTFRVPGYPELPAIYLSLSILLVVSAVLASPLHSLMGLVVIALGVPAFWWFKK